MQELRWILLAAGIVLIAVLYVLGVRARRRSATPEPARTARVEAPPVASTVAPRLEPHVGSAGSEPVDLDAPGPLIDEARLVDIEEIDDIDAEPELELESVAPSATPVAPLREPTPATQPREPALATPPVTSKPARPEPAPRDAPAPRQRQKIIALRVTATAPERFEGAFLEQALQAEGYAFGRFGIFHRLDASGRPILSLASLLEPGTFDPATMARCSYPGVALFAVLPGPVPAPQALEELVESGRYLAERLGGHLLDDRGAALSMQRIGQLREEVLDFERAPSASRGA